VYIRAFQQGSDLDDTVEEKLLIGDRPKHTSGQNKLTLKDRLRQRTDEELVEVIGMCKFRTCLDKNHFEVDTR
jgi:N-terminal acetyltransferase B complex non-catalytic subunit